MTTEYSGSGDPARSIELLWGTQKRPSRGPKPRLSAEQVARAAIQVADTHGLSALSMRRVADEIGVTAMSLYTYVPGKAELLDVMVDLVYAEIGEPDHQKGWRRRLETVARENWALYRRHPWLLQVATHRPVLGPNLMAKYDRELRAVDGIGLPDVEMDLLLRLVYDYVHGAVRSAVEAAQAEQQTGMTDEQWWSAHAPLLDRVFDPDRFPTAARVGTAAGEEYAAPHDPERSFEFGLARLLDGVEAFVQRRSTTSASPPAS